MNKGLKIVLYCLGGMLAITAVSVVITGCLMAIAGSTGVAIGLQDNGVYKGPTSLIDFRMSSFIQFPVIFVASMVGGLFDSPRMFFQIISVISTVLWGGVLGGVYYYIVNGSRIYKIYHVIKGMWSKYISSVVIGSIVVIIALSFARVSIPIQSLSSTIDIFTLILLDPIIIIATIWGGIWGFIKARR